jgi:glycosyltransferase involved in cell wall biosynthesis
VRIAITSNAPWAATGYGVQVAELSKQLKADNHQTAIMANYGLAGTTLNWNGIDVFQQGMEAYSNDLTPAQMDWWLALDKSKPGLALTLYDVWVYGAPQWDTLPIASWTPIDHKGVPHGVKAWFQRKGNGKWAIAMSRFGEQELLEAGVERDRLFYAPHSFDPAVYKPTPSDVRKQLNVPEDAHLTMINSANKGTTPVRKSWGEMLTAWSKWAKDRDDAYLYIHSDAFGVAQGVKLDALLQDVGASVNRVRIVPQFEYRMGIPAETLAKLYSTADVLLMTSKGEGFGVPLIEAQACATPIIATDWTAMTELCGSGWLVDGQEEYDALQGGWWKTPSVPKIMEALQASYEQKEGSEARKLARQKAVDFAQDYATPVVYDTHWRPILKELEGRLPAKP